MWSHRRRGKGISSHYSPSVLISAVFRRCKPLSSAELEAMAEETKPAEGSQPKEQVVDPWHVEAAEGEDKIDYEKLISKC